MSFFSNNPICILFKSYLIAIDIPKFSFGVHRIFFLLMGSKNKIKLSLQNALCFHHLAPPECCNLAQNNGKIKTGKAKVIYPKYTINIKNNLLGPAHLGS